MRRWTGLRCLLSPSDQGKGDIVASPKTPKDAITMAKEAGAQIVDLRFVERA